MCVYTHLYLYIIFTLCYLHLPIYVFECHGPSSILHTLLEIFNSNFTRSQLVSYYYYPLFKDEETEAEKSCVTCLRSHKLLDLRSFPGHYSGHRVTSPPRTSHPGPTVRPIQTERHLKAEYRCCGRGAGCPLPAGQPEDFGEESVNKWRFLLP